MKNVLLTFILLIVFSSSGNSQSELASPKIKNFTNKTYQAGLQNWGATQDKKGVIYFGNNEGLLTFNGNFWDRYQLPNKTIIRSVKFDSKDRLFVGGQDEIGYFQAASNGQLNFHSLKHLIPEHDRSFSDIWQIVNRGDEFFFLEHNRIYHFKNEVMQVFTSGTEWLYLGVVNDRVFAQDKETGLMEFSNGIWKKVLNSSTATFPHIVSILPFSADNLLVFTLSNGTYLLDADRLKPFITEIDELLRKSWVNTAIQIDSETYAIGTKSSGVLIIDIEGKPVQQFTFAQGLQTNNVRSIFVDKDFGLWIGLDDGIDYIDFQNPIKEVQPDAGKRVSGYTAMSYKNQLYLGTSDGLYKFTLSSKNEDLSLAKGEFTLIQGSEGQVWKIQEINDRLLMGHENGAFEIVEDHAKAIFNHTGAWVFQPATAIYPSSEIYVGTYTGMQLLSENGTALNDMGAIGELSESLRFLKMQFSTGELWGSHPYRGIYRQELSDDFSKVIKTSTYTAADGLPSDLYNYAFQVKNRILIATESGIYEFDQKTARFRQSDIFKGVLRGMSVQYLQEDQEGNVWFISNKNIGVIDYSMPQNELPFTIIYLPELSGNVIGGHEFIYAIDKKNILVGSNKGFYHINYGEYRKRISRPTGWIGKVSLFGQQDTVVYTMHSVDETINDIQEFSHTMNSIHLEYTSTTFRQLENLEYSYFLRGFDQGWSEWTDRSEKDYTNLGAGTYTFEVKSRNNLGNESGIAGYAFTILPAWYESVWAYLLYFIILIGTLFWFFTKQNKKHVLAQKHLRDKHSLALERTEKEIMRLKNDKLQAEINHKNQELGSTTMHLLQRGKVLAKIKEELMAESESELNAKKVIRLINEVERSDDDWNRFAIHFDHVHSNFLTILRGKFPALTANELKLCAFVKMNLSSKEIADLMSISLKAVEVGRYRLRKKLQISTEVNLHDFLIQITTS
ncbi:ligand-binding sensor domain-containing protein/DNA-binding CsgD family transcriptional regulator [Algoriphagus sp. 4150]|uniref:triple tyrosine motif-containing protein n=1 Tax=Algoriphagus sp. 4150 TaxID=2817756 RepID=UPI002854AF68|nr:triple tyrosine motif-containing protein [Algoriphagus sp. 4150]MDR7132596.1 ligand-binding sensor domain-containing protein/DNA-binding CsgD family transcriptional regulator [Algoriphagus sp. 4150]